VIEMDIQQKNSLSEKNKRWNQFINDICFKTTSFEDILRLNEIQKTAVLCFWYDSEMNSGGHSGYFDVYSDVDLKELYNSLIAIGAKKFAKNLQVAIKKGIKDDYKKTDNLFYNFHPSLGDILEEYVENNKDHIF
jgi:hypothetical protein